MAFFVSGSEVCVCVFVFAWLVVFVTRVGLAIKKKKKVPSFRLLSRTGQLSVTAVLSGTPGSVHLPSLQLPGARGVGGGGPPAGYRMDGGAQLTAPPSSTAKMIRSQRKSCNVIREFFLPWKQNGRPFRSAQSARAGASSGCGGSGRPGQSGLQLEGADVTEFMSRGNRSPLPTLPGSKPGKTFSTHLGGD